MKLIASIVMVVIMIINILLPSCLNAFAEGIVKNDICIEKCSELPFESKHYSVEFRHNAHPTRTILDVILLREQTGPFCDITTGVKCARSMETGPPTSEVTYSDTRHNLSGY